MPYATLGSDEQTQLREYVEAAQQRFATFRDNKETMAFAGLAIFLGAVATALVSQEWPPSFARDHTRLIALGFSVLWLFVAVYLRYQLRERRWAALRVAGCDWLLAEWLPDSPRAMETSKKTPEPGVNPGWMLIFCDVVWPLKAAVVAVDPELNVYPAEIERAWILAAGRGTTVLRHERLIHGAGWVGFGAVLLRTLLV